MIKTVTNREIDRQIFRILTPIIIENIFMMLSGLILTSYIGRLAVNEISIYGISNRVSNIFYALFRGMGVGVMIISAKAYGTGNKVRCRWLQHQSYLTIFPPAVLLTILIYFFARPVLTLMTSDPELLNGGEVILKQLSIFMSLQALIGLNAAAFQAFGDTRTPMLIAAFGNIISIIAGYVLIFGWGPFAGHGLIGAAWAMIISWIGMTVIGFFLIYGPRGLYSDVPEEHSLTELPSGQDVRTIYSTGVPVALENSYWNVATVYISRVILMYGSTYYASYQFGLQAEGICDIVAAGFLTGAMQLSAMAIGMQDEQLYRRYYKRLNMFCFAVCLLTMTFLAFFTRPILRVMTDKPELIEIAAGYLFAMVFSQIPQHMSKIISGYIRASGHSQAPMIISLLGIILRVILVILFGEVLHRPIVWIWWAFNIDLWFRYLLSIIYGRRKHVLDFLNDPASSDPAGL